MQRTILKGLTADHFVCPEEKKMRQDGILEKKSVKKLVETASASTDALMAAVREGTYVHLTEQTHPKLYQILRNVCRILDCPEVPDLYLVRREIPIAIPCGGKSLYIVLSTYTLDTYDEDMLYYVFGNAMSMVKAGHVHISQLMAYMPGGLVFAAPKAVLLRFVHQADQSSDRGGLLACQSLAAVVRCHLSELGLPPSQSRKLFTTDPEAAEFLTRYLAVQEGLEEKRKSILTKVAQVMQDLNTIEAPGNHMLRRLFQWYQDPEGYSLLISKAEEGRL